MKKALLVVLALVVAALALPPLWFRLSPVELPSLAAPEKFAELPSGVRMHYVERGEGPAVVLVHGLPGQASDWGDTISLLAAHGRRVIAIDRIAYGHSDARPNGDFTLEANARELTQLLDVLGLDDVTVVGWSYGGGTALVAAHQGAPRIGRLVLVGSLGVGGDAGMPPRAVLALSSLVFRWVHAVPPAGIAVQRAMSAQAFSEQPMPASWLPSLTANMVQAKTFAAFSAEGAAIDQAHLPDSAGLDLPILVIHGDGDRLVPIAVGRTLARNNPRAELEEIPGGSHMLPITHAQLLADRIASFSAPPPADEPASPPGADAGSPSESPEHWMDVLAAR
ncbi:MAG TPA: alpha/beta hydrolase [Myxococcota bacterium]|nr:alpha/beta hydrolase [Myxococcota bacterium]